MVKKKTFKYDAEKKLILYTIHDISHVKMECQTVSFRPNCLVAEFKPTIPVKMMCSSCRKTLPIFLFNAKKYLPLSEKKPLGSANEFREKPYYTDFIALCESCAVIREIEK